MMGDSPEYEIDRVEFLSNRASARAAGVKRIPALVYGEKKLTGVLLTKGRIREFLNSL